MEFDDKKLKDLLIELGLFWRFPEDDPNFAYHAELQSGMHSDAFGNISELGTYTEFVPDITRALIAKTKPFLIGAGYSFPGIDWVIGSGYASNVWAYEFARQIGVKRWGWTDKKPITKEVRVGDETLHVLTGKDEMVLRFDLEENAIVFQVEDMQTSMETTERSRQAILKRQPTANIIPVVPCPFAWGDEFPFASGRQVVPLLREYMTKVSPADCKSKHHCSRDSVAIKPKLPGNWAKLTGKADIRRVA